MGLMGSCDSFTQQGGPRRFGASLLGEPGGPAATHWVGEATWDESVAGRGSEGGSWVIGHAM